MNMQGQKCSKIRDYKASASWLSNFESIFECSKEPYDQAAHFLKIKSLARFFQRNLSRKFLIGDSQFSNIVWQS